MTTPRSRAEPATLTVDDKTLLVPQEQVDCVIVIGLFKEPIIGSLKSMIPEIRHLENRHDIIFFCRWWSDLDKISETGAESHVDCGDVVEIETRCRISNMADVLANSMACHPRATYHIAGCCHLPRRSLYCSVLWQLPKYFEITPTILQSSLGTLCSKVLWLQEPAQRRSGFLQA